MLPRPHTETGSADGALRFSQKEASPGEVLRLHLRRALGGDDGGNYAPCRPVGQTVADEKMNDADRERTLVAREIARSAAHEVLREAFQLFGVDITRQDSVNEFRDDLIHTRRARRLSERIASIVVLSAIPLVLLGILAALLFGLKAMGKWFWPG